MSLLSKAAKSVGKAVKKAFTTPSKRAEEARKQYTNATSSGGNNKVVESVKNWASSVKPQQNENTVRPSYSVSSYKNVPQDIKAFYNQQNKALKADAKEAWRKGGIEQRRAASRGQTYTGGQFSYASQSARNIYDERTAFDPNSLSSWNELGKRRAKGEAEVNRGMQNFYFTNGLKDEDHRAIIGRGEDLLNGTAVEDYLGIDKIETYEDLEAAEKRWEEYQKYMKKYYIERSVYNSDTGEFETHYVIRSDAPLPPWANTKTMSLTEWSYYRGFQSETGTILHDQAMALWTEQEKYRKHGYKSAFNLLGDENKASTVDSFADVVYASLGSENKGKAFLQNYKNYVKDYYVNPYLAGKFGTVIGNHLWNLMDTMDFASRGTRAFVAGSPELGGLHKTGHTFEGQDVFWAVISKEMNDDHNHYYQELFLDNGGYELLQRNRGEKIGHSSKLTDEEIIAQLEEAFSGAKISWKDVYDAINEQYYNTGPKGLFQDLKQGVENVKETYTNPEAAFYADMGNVAGDILLETVLDPGLLIGGTAKSAARSSADDVARIALNDVLKDVSKLSDGELAEALNSKAVRKAMSTFSGSNEGRNIIFKNGAKLEADANALSKVLSEAGVLDDVSRIDFQKGMLNALTGKQFEINGKIIGAQAFKEIRDGRKLAKTAAYVDKAIDTIDMAIIKGSFIEPVAIAKLYKGGKMGAKQFRIIRNLLAENKLKADDAFRTAVEESRNTGIYGSLKTYAKKVDDNLVKEDDVLEDIRVIKNQFTTAAARLENIQSELGYDALEKSLAEADAVLKELTGASDNTLASLDGLITNLRKKYSLGGDLEDVFSSLKRSYVSFTEALEHEDGVVKKNFLEELRKANSSDELAILINRYSDRLNMPEMRVLISDNIPSKKLIPEEEISKIFDEFSAGILSERPAVAADIINGEKALSDAATSSHRVSSSSSEVSNILNKLPHLSEALNDAEKYPFLSSLAAKLAQITDIPADAADATISTKRIINEIIQAHSAVSEGRALKIKGLPYNKAELKQISDELLDFKVQLEKMIDTTNVEIVNTYHMDKQAKYNTLISDNRFVNLFGKFYDSAFKPAVDLLESKIMQGTDAFGNSKIYENLKAIEDLKYSYRRYRRLVRDLERTNISDEAKYAVLNGLFGSYGESGKKLIEVTRQPGKVRKWLDTMMYNEFSSSKVGMDTLTARLKTIDDTNPDSMIADYVDEIKNNQEVYTWYKNLMDGDPADPEVYMQKQILSTVLLDPDAIARFNKYDKAPIFVHVSTTGLSDNAAITGISYYRWQRLELTDEGKPSVKAIYDALHSEGASNTIKRTMSDAEIDNIELDTLYGIYKTSLGERSLNESYLRARYKNTFGEVVGKTGPKSEAELLEEFFSEVYRDTYTYTKRGILGRYAFETVVPTFVVHDLDGFNMPFINQRAAISATESFPRTLDYSRRLSGRAANNTLNTFDDLRHIVNDNMLSDPELREIEELIKNFAQDLSTNTGKEFSMLDIESVPDKMQTIFDELDNFKPAPEEDDIIKALRSVRDVKASDKALTDARKVISDLEILDDEANQIATLSSASRVDTIGNLGNTVRSASQVTGQRMLNVDDRYNLRTVRRFFSLGNIDNGIKETYHNIGKMSGISRYVDEKLRYSVRHTSESFLSPKKRALDNIIVAVSELAQNASRTDGYFGYLRYLKVPETATESYLICQKLYDDLLKYWLNTALARDYTMYQQFGKVSDRLKPGLRDRLLSEFVDELNISSLTKKTKNGREVYFKNLKMTSETYYELINLFEGEGQSMIFKDVPIEYLSAFSSYTSHGKISDGVDLARKLKRGYTQMKGIIQEQEYLDSLLRSSGIVNKHDFEMGLMFTHTAEFMDITKEGAFFMHKPVRNAVKQISDLHVMRVQNLRMKRLIVDGKLNKDKVLAELLYNNANHILFQKSYFRDYEIKKVRSFVNKLQKEGLDYIKIAEDRGAISIYLTNKCEVCRVMEDGREVRFLRDLSNDTFGSRYYKPELEHIALPTQHELMRLDLDAQIPDELKDTFWAMYNKLRECWADVSYMSEGASNGTLGRVVFDNDMEEYYKIANTFMPDLLSNKGLRTAHMYGTTVYDPGFMLQGDYDIVTDFLHTMQVQAEHFKASGALINNVFGSGNEFNFGELTKYATDKELVDMFRENSDFVVCALIPAKDTKTGLRVRRLKFDTVGDVAAAKQLSNTAVLPYDTYLEMTDAINVKAYTTDLNRAINKLMLVYKAGALFHPGTWVRNFIDATQKATTDLGQSPLGIFDTFFYELRCMKDIYNYQKLLRYGDDFLSEANWNTVRFVTGSDMSYENFELLRGMFDSSQYTSKAQWRGDLDRLKAGGREVISGDRVGLNNLSERDITKAYAQANKYKKINMDQKRFVSIYTGLAKPEGEIEEKLYAESMRTISDFMHSAKAIPSLTNAVHASFIPFNIGEMTVRYAQIRRLNELGFSNNQALRRVHLTQFKQVDHYGIPNKLEYIVPFITFKYNNVKYWMRMMDENPAYFKYFEKLYGNIAEYTAEQYNEKGQQLDYESSWMLKSGGIPIGNGKYYFKINPSFFDAMQTIYGFPSELISNQNPLLRIATRSSMYNLGLNMKYIFNSLNLNPGDVNQDLSSIAEEIAPRLARLKDLDKISVSKFMTWANETGPSMEMLYKLVPSLIGRNYFNDYNASTFEEYQESLAKDGLWYDCNTGEIVDISLKNTRGMNAPSQSTEGVKPEDNPISWMDVNNYMMIHFNKIWDANVGKFVPFWEQTKGGLNQGFDFANDPEAWDRLCKEMYERKGMRFDYNTKKFIRKEYWSPTGLNNSALSFEDRVELMSEKFPNLKWDANQNTFVEDASYISGGLNAASRFNEVQLFRYALFGQLYDKESHKFYDATDAKVVKLGDLTKLKDYDNYFAMLGIPRLADVTSKIHLDSNGLLVTEDGRYVLTSNNDYNNRVFNQIRGEYGSLFPGYSRRGRYYHNYYNYTYNKLSPRNKAPYRGMVNEPKSYLTGYGWNEEKGYYRLEYEQAYQYHSTGPSSSLHRLIVPPVHYPYGGGYSKFSFYYR